MTETTPAETPDATAKPPLTVNLVVQMAGMHRMDSDENFRGDLPTAAESFCRYFVGNLQKLTEPRGGDLLVIVQLDRGGELAGYQYREGRYVTTPGSSGDSLDPDVLADDARGLLDRAGDDVHGLVVRLLRTARQEHYDAEQTRAEYGRQIREANDRWTEELQANTAMRDAIRDFRRATKHIKVGRA